MHLLAVDDDPSILELLQALIQFSTEHTVETASCAADALNLLAQTKAKAFDCFLMDIQMPGTDGIALCKILRSQPNHKQTPILMLTAMSDKSYINRAYSAGANDFITKPFDIVDLRERLGLMDRYLAGGEKQAEMPENRSLREAGIAEKISITLKLGKERIRMGYALPATAMAW